jgi:ankyrin repeat protein
MSDRRSHCAQLGERGAGDARIVRNAPSELHDMDDRVREVLALVGSTPDFCGVTFDSINATNALGDNALHCVCLWGDLEAAKLRVEHGINIHQRGELGFTPLRVAVDFGHPEVAEFLLASGANVAAVDAPEEFDPEANARHLGDLQVRIDAQQCDGKGDTR